MKIETGYKFPFEKRAYTEDSSEEELAAIINQTFVYDEDLLYYKELPIVSELSINLCFDQVEALGENMNKHGLLIDITETKPPGSRIRRAINKRFKDTCESLEHVSFWVGKNILISTTARFVMYQTNLESYSIHTTQEAAIKAIKEKLHG